jgi:hypothetical protein
MKRAIEVFGFMLLVSQYFYLLMLRFCTVLMVVNNIIYLVILGGVLLVVFVTTILIGSVTNMFIPLLMSNIAVKGGSVFMIMMLVVMFL